MLKSGEMSLMRTTSTDVAVTFTGTLTSWRVQNIRLPARIIAGFKLRRTIRSRLQSVSHHVTIVARVDLQHRSLTGFGSRFRSVQRYMVGTVIGAVTVSFSTHCDHYDHQHCDS